jgi:F-box protein 9
MAESAAELEQFRQQWKQEVDARTKKTERVTSSRQKARRISDARPERPVNVPPTRHPAADIQHDDSDHQSDADQAGGSSTAAVQQRLESLNVSSVDEDDFMVTSKTKREPTNALEHFERAVEKESQGNLGDSLSHYRKAYRLDAKVDQSYKNKHHAAAWKSKPTNTNPSNAAVTVPGTAHHSLEGPKEHQMTFDELIHSFVDASIEGVPAIIPGDRPPVVAIQKLPAEVLLELLRHVAIRDPAVFVRLSLVCKKLAFHVITDNNIWKRISLGPEFGLASQQYTFKTDIQGREAIYQTLEDEDDLETLLDLVSEAAFAKDTIWRDVFHNYPRIRFTGVYISTVNYTRPGGSSATASTWSNPVHIVTYYRYLRFFRDGTCISLLTTSEPVEVVHHLTPENLTLVRSTGKKDGGAHPLNFLSSAPALLKDSGPKSSSTIPTSTVPNLPPTARDVMKHALRGRWRLCHPSISDPVTTTSSSPTKPTMAHGDLHIETEGAGPRYMYTMHLSLKNAGSAKSKHTTKNNKLVWKGFWSLNMLTSDWAEFHLRNDKPFYFSRVKGYGLGY